jgi:hypothetical protein
MSNNLASRGWEISGFGKKLWTLTRYLHLKLIPLVAECELPIPDDSPLHGHSHVGVEFGTRGEPIGAIRQGPRMLGNKKDFRLKFYERSLPSQELSLPHSTWLYWSEFGSTMGALSCPEGGKMGVSRVGSSKLGPEPN